MELKETGKVIGNIYCGSREFEAIEIGYIVNKDYQKNGYALEALNAVAAAGFAGASTGFTRSAIRATNRPGGCWKPPGFERKHFFGKTFSSSGMKTAIPGGRIPVSTQC